jgi:murein DD-endopeptidase MepM/ murein hydrolase activator NlpD
MKATVISLVLVLLVSLSAFPVFSQSPVLYRRPLASNPAISAWYDHDTRSGYLLRYDGSTSFPYDGHHGTDFPIARGTTIVSGATGQVYYGMDGCYEVGDPGYDSNCGGGFGNHVRMVHFDGHVTIYAHMKRGTPICACLSAICGAPIGQVGGSGYVIGANPWHVHFELWSDKSGTQRLDFFGGQPNNHPNYWTTFNNPSATCQ